MADKPSKRFKAPQHWSLTQRLQQHSMPDPSGCRIWIGNQVTGGYGSLGWRGKMRRAHRLAWEIANGPIPDGLDVLHKCDVPACINPDHLWLGTDADNKADSVAKGRHWKPRGILASGVRLTESDVRAIRASTLCKPAPTKPALAKKYGVTVRQIYHVINREQWAHLPD